MEPKRPFSNLDWAATPELVRQYIKNLEHTIFALLAKVEHLEKRTEKLSKFQ